MTGTYCVFCGIHFDTVTEARKHHLAEHYDYVLAQCNYDKKILLEWASLDYPLDSCGVD